MKKTIFILSAFVLCMNISGFSQKSRVGMTSGLSTSTLCRTIGGVKKDVNYRVGYVGGLQLEVPLGKKQKFSFQPDLTYIQKGGSINPVAPATDKLNIALRYAQLAPNFVYNCKVKLTNGFFYFGAGPYIGFNLPSKKITVSATGEKIETDVSFGNAVANDVKGIDYGGNCIIGYRTKYGLFVSANHIFGLRNLVPDAILALPVSANDKTRNHGFAVRLGYYFSNTPRVKKAK